MTANTQPLRRELGFIGAVLLGLGSILGTGVFVSIGFGVSIAGAGVVPAIVIGGLLAACNGLSSAQLAAAHPVSGGTYEYGYRLLHPALGFTAGWMFLCAKSASAATAALGFAAYLLPALGVHTPARWQVLLVALVALLILTSIVLSGIRRSNTFNAIIVLITIGALGVFVTVAGLAAVGNDDGPLTSRTNPDTPSFRDVLHASALMFVAYTGYGRIATLGEEVHHPRRTIPRAIVTTLMVSMVLYLAVGIAGLAAVGPEAFSTATVSDTRTTAPLEHVAAMVSTSTVTWIVAVGAMTAMLGVLLNLILGLSRVVLSMGRRGDAPRACARITSKSATPSVAVIVVAVFIACLALAGDARLTWSFSAFTVLLYYSITNLAALRLPTADRLYPRWIAVSGLMGCLGLAWWVDIGVILAGVGLLAAGLGWHRIMQGRARKIAA